ncbi:MAG: cupin domain-containing protein [Gammaproteobacteria bacterium]|nr:cupin domain-containing protein [Gammaproteobacteria bacterium]MCI0590264.1 cupin domain-containing protein [Gammaproteobacteria bacterium]
MDLLEIKTDWEKRGFTCDVWVDPPGQVWQDFVHGTDELVMLIEGEIELSFQGKTLRPSIAEEIVIPAGARHTVINIGKTTNRWYYGNKKPR